MNEMHSNGIKCNPFEYYLAQFKSLNCKKTKGEIAPHKGILLLAIMSEIEQGNLKNGFIPINQMMVNAFNNQWKMHVGTSSQFRPAFHTPFFHMSFEPFWTLIKRDSYVEIREYSYNQLKNSFYGAMIDEVLWVYMEFAPTRHLLKKALLEKYFPNYKEDNNTFIESASSSCVADPEINYSKPNNMIHIA